IVFVDTGVIFAASDTDDINHSAAKKLFRILKQHGDEPLLTNFVVAETHALFIARTGAHAARRWLAAISWQVRPVLPTDEERAREIIFSHIDKTYSYTDA